MDAATTRCAESLLRETLAPLASLIADEAVTEIMVNPPAAVWVQRAGRVEPVAADFGAPALRTAVVLLGRLAGRGPGVEGSDPWVETCFDGLRVAACLPPLSPAGPVLCLRRHRRQRPGLAELARAAPDQAATLDLLAQAVRRGEAILLAGATDSGKTTLLNALCGEIPPHERVISLEDTPELAPALPHHVALVRDSATGASLRDLLRLALRLRPDRILVGEVRGAEAYDLVQAASTGHRGTMATVHAGDVRAALARVESLALCAGVPWPVAALREAIVRAFDLIAILERSAGVRAVRQLVRVRGWDADGGYRLQWLADASGPGSRVSQGIDRDLAAVVSGVANARR